jgi:hypothetical protein
MKGRQFDGIDDPQLPRLVRQQDEAIRTAWVDAYNARFATVEVCADCGRDLIAEEVIAHHINHLRPRTRVLARMFEDADQETQAELLSYLATRP